MRDVKTQTAEELLNELRTLVKEAEKTLGDSIAETSDETLSALRARFVAAQERLTELYGDTKQKIIAGGRKADETIRENPYQALAIAVGVGVLLGVLLGRRTK
ncbi:MAG TPA: hypothetical protein VGD81_17595 [Opitutaceae bacterium]